MQVPLSKVKTALHIQSSTVHFKRLLVYSVISSELYYPSFIIGMCAQ